MTNTKPPQDAIPTVVIPETVKQYKSFPGIMPESERKNKVVRITTSYGVIEITPFSEYEKTVSNFLFLAQEGFYSGIIIHRVENGFVVQTGDPLGNGTGGPGYRFEDEPVKHEYKRGIVAMANAGPNTNGSQFFIMLADRSDLAPQYNIIGSVTKGMDVVDKLQIGDKMEKVEVIKSP